jgi:L-fucose mutarotase/ribose pyranase (RbsD/FucU family)
MATRSSSPTPTSPRPAWAAGKPVIALPGADVRAPCEAVLSLLPLDASVAQPVAYMQVCDTPAGYRSRAAARRDRCLQADGQVTPARCEAMERFAFYDRVRPLLPSCTPAIRSPMATS